MANFSAPKKTKKQSGQQRLKLFAIPAEYMQNTLEDLLEDWRVYYQDYFNTTFVPAKLKIPQQPAEDYILLVVNAGAEQIINVCRENFRIIKDIDQSVEKSSESLRSAKNAPYAVWVRRHDSANVQEHVSNLKKSDFSQAGLTIAERLIYDHRYHLEHGVPPDIFIQSLCQGDKFPDGQVRCLFYSDESLIIGRHGQDDKELHLCGLDVAA